eukprot:TRINITY_DN21716_c0_g4_i1.p1 TRINITY_DN21716_c0_g4~~TRINITY_DN21716_c0_g4_i1.p1  ORF type:complete len:433 (+),score=76.60 TRINITY_DN21716_c0_g4_i1:86-1300(+)
MAAAAAAVAAAVGGALAAAGGAVVAAVGAVQLTAFTWDGNFIRECPELASSGPLLACSAGYDHYATVSGSRGGAVRCAGDNGVGQLGTRDMSWRRRALGATDPPLTAISVGCGFGFTFALHGDGAVSSWGRNYTGQSLGRGGDSRPAIITGIPPVALLGVGTDFAIAVTHNDDVYGWGRCGFPATMREVVPYPERIPVLCGRGLRRLACASGIVVAEAAAGLFRWCGLRGELSAKLACSADMCFPLRGLAHFHYSAFMDSAFMVVAADGAGAVWVHALNHTPLHRVLAKVRAVAAAAAERTAVVLSEEGQLYDVRPGRGRIPDLCRAISSPQLPLGLVPHGGAASRHVVLVPDHCGGKARLRIFARIAVRLGLPADPLCARLTLYAVNGVYVHGGPADPFGYWP